MKKIIITTILCFMFFPIKVNGEKLDLAKSAKSALIMEYSTGKILYSKNIDEKLPPASMTKMMSLLLVMEYIESGGMKEDDMVKISQNAASMGGSQIFLKADEEMSVRDLLKGVSIASANDGIVALAERVYGTEEVFVEKMNEKVKQLGLKNTNFKNVHGLDEANHYSSARDMALIAKELIRHENILKYSSIYEQYLRENSDEKVWLVNTNKLVRFYNGADGLKTGYTKGAGYCLTATAKRNNMRLITVVMNSDTSNNRNSDSMSMLDYGFNQYEIEILIKKGNIIKKEKLSKTKEKEVNIVPKEDVTVLSKKGEKKKNADYELDIKKIKLPIKKGDIIGILLLKEDNNLIRRISLTVDKNIDKISFIDLYKNHLKDIFLGKENN